MFRADKLAVTFSQYSLLAAKKVILYNRILS
jgi:hypothetical protein